MYSLGVVAHELLTGGLPFWGEGMLDLAVQHVSSDVPPMLRQGVPLAPQLEAVVRRAMAKDADRRFQSAGDFALALEAAVKTAPA